MSEIPSTESGENLGDDTHFAGGMGGRWLPLRKLAGAETPCSCSMAETAACGAGGGGLLTEKRRNRAATPLGCHYRHTATCLNLQGHQT